MRRPLTIMNILLAATIACPATSEAAKIVVDAGHGGSNPGAVGVNGLYEKTVNLDIAEKLKDLLAARGYEVAMTRSDDTFISLK
ncbi:N-acetylmuramoyl-L-alanine amidase [Paenibacillus sp. TAB 01]|uniref:N-acetylmuramoyl-L-alanine amidase family protein n=1 Tax=Paenibacillus sp. TAB 01 TaxID=3368988 RepID=UPI003750DE1A